MKHSIRCTLAGLVMAMILISPAYADIVGGFPDVPENADYAEAVGTLCDLGIITGDEKGNFNPDNTITRAETAAIICRLMGVEEDAKAMTGSAFSDVPASHWAVGYVAKTAELGIINGYGNGKFGPSDPVTYEQVVKMLVCASECGDWAEAEGGYPDGYLSVAAEIGITDGMSFTSTSHAPRSDVAILCYQSLNAMSNSQD